MSQLHLVGVSPSRRELVFSEDPDDQSGSYVVIVDDALVAAVAAARDMGRPAAPMALPKPEPAPLRSGLSPREIQTRIRSGRTVAEVAREAQVDESWIERFAGPILAEQQAVVERAGALSFHAPRKGESAQPLSDSVRRNLLLRGGTRAATVEFDEGWSARQLQGAEWVVRFTYESRRHRLTAEWLADLGAGTVRALDRLAATLAFVAPDDPEATPPEIAPTLLPRQPAGRRRRRPSGTAAPRPVGRPAGQPAPGVGSARLRKAAAAAPAPPGHVPTRPTRNQPVSTKEAAAAPAPVPAPTKPVRSKKVAAVSPAPARPVRREAAAAGPLDKAVPAPRARADKRTRAEDAPATAGASRTARKATPGKAVRATATTLRADTKPQRARTAAATKPRAGRVTAEATTGKQARPRRPPAG